jgi:osmotically-inducible protein OsmY
MWRGATRRRNVVWQSLYVWVLALLVVQGLLAIRLDAEERPLDPQAITLAVETALRHDSGVPAHLVDVSTRDGIVTLSGWVDSLLAKERAGEIAATIKGVRAVINQIAITTVRPDGEILEDVRAALQADPATDSYEINSMVNDGVVTLFGTVDSWSERRLSAQVAASVKGAKSINNELTVAPQPKRPDHEIAADIRRRLAADVWVDERLIDVTVKEGEVSLSGTVGSAAEKTRAALDAWVAGVAAVHDSELQVNWRAHNSARRVHPYIIRTDEEVTQALYDALRYDPRVLAFQPEVKVNNGVVSLTGTVDNLAAKRAAAEDAKNTVGVRRVRNYLRVRPVNLVPDGMLVDHIKAALQRDPHVERYEVIVSVVNGKAFLSGVVDSQFEKDQAEDVASRVAGVIAVDNNITMASTPLLKSDWEITQDIKDELWWSPYVDSSEIAVSVKDGVATLRGLVEGWAEQRVAIENAYEGGAFSVRDELTIRGRSAE